jgi:hypothetical protein
MSLSKVRFRLLTGWGDTEAQTRLEKETGTRNATRVK